MLKENIVWEMNWVGCLVIMKTGSRRSFLVVAAELVTNDDCMQARIYQ